ncbi:hypothetical protein KQI61_06000 [Anaerocolumna aminovalerica]|nr:hypothetical protein [Anaerocolumna aminovalerica]MBU5331743.1 hypothetical protein [Anaerocolumna aminovalerica]
MDKNEKNRSQLPKPPEPLIVRDSFGNLGIIALLILIIMIAFICLLK